MITKEEFRATVAELMDLDAGQLQDHDSRDTVAGWSSLVDIQIFALIAEKTPVEPTEALLELATVADLIGELSRQKAFSD